jgi:hypothetical protein
VVGGRVPSLSPSLLCSPPAAHSRSISSDHSLTSAHASPTPSTQILSGCLFPLVYPLTLPPPPSSRAVGRRSLCTQRHILIASNIAIASSLALLIPGQRFSARLVCYSSRSKASSSKASNGSSSSTSSVASVTIIRGETTTPHTPIRSSMLIFRRTDPETTLPLSLEYQPDWICETPSSCFIDSS